ncbi:Gfo/Idh/MocA family oxidoreductase, partial [Candidatus Aerophobetes bacterium]|nr:Gfo/Idh/MocA family oxidoreductase [Candidatus Aerophobetes bacterium]
SRELNIPCVFEDHQQALSWGNFDAAIVTTPTFTHCEIVKDLARGGKHIFCEKPIALTLKEADLMIEECEKNRVKFQIGFMRRFDPEFIFAKKKVEEKAIGELLLIKSTGRGPGLPPEWAWDIKKSGGMLAEVASHDFDTLMWFAQSRLESVEAVAANYRCPELNKKYPDFYDTAVVVGTFENGKIGIIDVSCPASYGYDARLELLGSRGVMFVGDIQQANVILCTQEKGIYSPQYRSWKERFKEGYINELQHFIHCVTSNSTPLVSGEDGRKALACVIASNRSIFTGKKERVAY